MDADGNFRTIASGSMYVVHNQIVGRETAAVLPINIGVDDNNVAKHNFKSGIVLYNNICSGVAKCNTYKASRIDIIRIHAYISQNTG